MPEHAVGNQVVLCGTITAIEGDVALVKVDRASPEGGTIAVRLGKLPDSAPANEVDAARVRSFYRRFRLY